jgi:hypothetical protein
MCGPGSPLSGSPRKSPATAAQRGWSRIGNFRGCPARGRADLPHLFLVSRCQTAIRTTPFRCAARICRAVFFLPSARPGEGVGGAPRWRIQRSRLRSASDHAYEACIAPIPNRCARLSALRLAVSAAGAALPWSLATATGPVLCPPLLLRDKALGVVPHPVVNSGGRTPPLLLPRLFTVAPEDAILAPPSGIASRTRPYDERGRLRVYIRCVV